MKKWRIEFIVLAVLAVLGGGFYAYMHSQPKQVEKPVVVAQEKPKEYPIPTREELLKLVNEERARNGVAPLVIDERLNQSAQRKSDDMVTYNYFGHISPNDGKHGYEYAHEVMPECKIVSENITDNISSNDSWTAVHSWIRSDKHHQAMVDSKYTYTGFGIADTKITEHFCQP